MSHPDLQSFHLTDEQNQTSRSETYLDEGSSWFHDMDPGLYRYRSTASIDDKVDDVLHRWPHLGGAPLLVFDELSRL